MNNDTETVGIGSSALLGSVLSEEEVSQLKDGDKVSVVWSGGNGPHEYEIGITISGQVAVKHRLRGSGGDAGRVYRMTVLDFVGTKAPRTLVRRVLPNPMISHARTVKKDLAP